MIESADSTLDYDRTVKWPLYAAAQIPDYWIFNLVDQCLEAYRQPYRNPPDQADYRFKQIVLPHETIALPFAPDLMVDLAQIFPTKA